MGAGGESVQEEASARIPNFGRVSALAFRDKYRGGEKVQSEGAGMEGRRRFESHFHMLSCSGSIQLAWMALALAGVSFTQPCTSFHGREVTGI